MNVCFYDFLDGTGQSVIGPLPVVLESLKVFSELSAVDNDHLGVFRSK